MSILCKIFGHETPTQRHTGWWSPGQEYITGHITKPITDGTGRRHCNIYDKCQRCGEKYILCRLHLPDWLIQMTPQIEELKELREGYAEAIDDIYSWGLYASEYFQDKHDLNGCIRHHREILLEKYSEKIPGKTDHGSAG